MKRKSLSEMTEEELVAAFRDGAIEQKDASENNKFSKYNKLFTRILEIAKELKERLGDRRRDLIPLLAHENIQVRLMAGNETLAVAPEAARRTLQEIKDSKWFPFTMDAGSTLSGLDSGRFRPE
ncbi:DUF2019 domain-containing protein [Aquabacter spiritensis]|uniref:Uncharacterized protein DUF2019 n=1 Tax=Aquabacter spiritensis TaxID=933073 RepID=A0A4R3M414_9HYPH|nr:DUF2019 domain-containing protein [Aquabacter spiritensis]TCT08024.1 uncharacterized protein DUF2019 [Aquabacter spiritensis]